jgi:SAM-dependent methyltransferase
MAALPPRLPADRSHEARAMAESFGSDAERYDRSRPTYPQALVDRILAESPGREVLDVGIGTGIAARGFAAAGCRVLGVEVDARMAEYARGRGFEVEVAKFEEWDPAGRLFDAAISGQTWHWIEPVAGARKAAEALRPAGRLAVFWNAFRFPPELGAALSDVYARALPDSPLARGMFLGREAYAAQLAKTAHGIRGAGAFGEPEEWQFDWDRRYTRDEWLDLVPTAGGINLLPPEQLEPLLDGIGAAIDDAGGSFTMHYAAIAVTAVRS